jgi:hypothetical protein
MLAPAAAASEIRASAFSTLRSFAGAPLICTKATTARSAPGRLFELFELVIAFMVTYAA